MRRHPNPATETYAPSLGVNIAQMTRIADGLYIQDLVVGTGATASAGHGVSMTYTGWLVDGTQFDSNVGKPALSFTLGAGQVIQGWDLGILNMKAGGKRRLQNGPCHNGWHPRPSSRWHNTRGRKSSARCWPGGPS
jgi:hypothetical protein